VAGRVFIILESKANMRDSKKFWRITDHRSIDPSHLIIVPAVRSSWTTVGSGGWPLGDGWGWSH